MTAPTFIVDFPLTAAAEVMVTGSEGRHAVTVKRLTPGEVISLVDGHGTRATATVTATTGKDQLHAHIDAVVHIPAPTPTVSVVQAIGKSERAELTVDLLTEAGVDEIIPWAASRSIGSWAGKAEKARAKWINAATQAAKQARRAWIPQVGSLASTADVCARVRAENTVGLVLHEEASVPLVEALPAPAPASIVLIVGPEGGISPAEVEQFVAAGARPVRLGPEVLRTATAGMVALAVIGAYTERWNGRNHSE
ncbi:MAG: 16S rRNA (uracil(1498)-N(3))-methyltransferase [Corynebacterium sp.]|nr:16S rRNA (uracil(1498)-N(3))-methyltransferase [Corynebacterium sp.]